MKILRYQADIPRHIVWAFKNKCKYYDLVESNVLKILMKKFNEGEFDDELNLPK